ncbi:hypothetical protein J6590_066887 [Homalodisca vitripennis]|nr:hypothetical protein J6590_066887 [Homalodisca vitripennis]
MKIFLVNLWCLLLLVFVIAKHVHCVTDLVQLDKDISIIYQNPDPAKKLKLMEDVRLYLETLRRFNTMTKKGCPENSEQAAELVHSGGPNFLKSFAFYSDEEQVLRYKMNFTDFQFQEYQYYRLDAENEWSELKDQIAHLDRDRERENELRRKNY